jgi:hypothetical protein
MLEGRYITKAAMMRHRHSDAIDRWLRCLRLASVGIVHPLIPIWFPGRFDVRKG